MTTRRLLRTVSAVAAALVLAGGCSLLQSKTTKDQLQIWRAAGGDDYINVLLQDLDSAVTYAGNPATSDIFVEACHKAAIDTLAWSEWAKDHPLEGDMGKLNAKFFDDVNKGCTAGLGGDFDDMASNFQSALDDDRDFTTEEADLVNS